MSAKALGIVVKASARYLPSHGERRYHECVNAATGKDMFTYPTQYQDALGKGDSPRRHTVIHGDKVITLGGMLLPALDAGKLVWAHSFTKE